MNPRCAVLIVNGFDRHGRWGDYDINEARHYPWIRICLNQIKKHSPPGDYMVMVYDNSWLTTHRRAMQEFGDIWVLPRNGARVELSHPAALDHLVRKIPASISYVITLDNDAFPIADHWIDEMISALEAGSGVAGIYRDEMFERIRPFIHPSCLCARRVDLLTYGVSFRKGDGDDIGQQLSDILCRDRPYHPLRRSNRHNVHPVMGGIYGELVYHHGAGGRRPRFWGGRLEQATPMWSAAPTRDDEVIREVLRDAAFADLPGLISELRGERPPALSLPPAWADEGQATGMSR